MLTVFVDECGYTGPDLLSTDQPVFVLASLGASEEECRAFRERFFDGVSADELKHSALCRRERGRKRILAFLEHVVAFEPPRVRFCYAHKRFALVCKMVDLIIEPSMYQMGYDAYDRGMNLALANVTYIVCSSLGADGLFDEILSAFQTLVRDPTLRHLAVFRDAVEPSTGIEPLDDVLRNFHLAVCHLSGDLLQLVEPIDLDLCLTFAVELLSCWRSGTAEGIEVVHDASSAMASQLAVWDSVVDVGVPPETVGYDRRKRTYPIAVERTRLEASHDWAGLQLADLLAGCLARVIRSSLNASLESDEYAQRVLSLVGERSTSGLIWPQAKFSPEELGTVGSNAADSVDHTAELLRKAGLSLSDLGRGRHRRRT